MSALCIITHMIDDRLMTYTLIPADAEEGTLLWVKVALVTFVSLIEPLFEPYPFEPVDPQVSHKGLIRLACGL